MAENISATAGIFLSQGDKVKTKMLVKEYGLDAFTDKVKDKIIEAIPGLSADLVSENEEVDKYVLFPDIEDPVQLDIKLAELYLYKVHNAQERNIEFSLTLKDFKAILMRKRCQYSHKLFRNEDGLNPTLERVDSSKGYTKDNTILVMQKMNKLKNMLMETPRRKYTYSANELINFGKYLSKNK